MSIFWNKQKEPNRVIYTRTKAQKKRAYILIIVGFLLIIGLPTLIKNISGLSALSSKIPSIFIFLVGLGFVMIIYTAIGVSRANFALFAAKSKNRKFEILSNTDGDTVIIEK